MSHPHDSRTLRTILTWLTDYPYPKGYGWGVPEFLAATKLPPEVIEAALTVLVWEGVVDTDGTVYRLAEVQTFRPTLVFDGGDAS